jgi:hypothetical protein
MNTELAVDEMRSALRKLAIDERMEGLELCEHSSHVLVVFPHRGALVFTALPHVEGTVFYRCEGTPYSDFGSTDLQAVLDIVKVEWYGEART